MRSLAPPLATLATIVTLAALGQGCLLGRNLYLDEIPAVDELAATSSVDQTDAASVEPSRADSAGGGDAGGGGDASDDEAPITLPPVLPPPPPPPKPNTPPVAGAETCTAIATECVKGGPMQTCITTSGAGVCTKLAYTHSGKAYVCTTGCTSDECLPSYYAAYTSCQDAAGACSQLAVCCEAAGLFRRLACREAHKTYVKEPYGDVACKAALTSYRNQGVCP